MSSSDPNRDVIRRGPASPLPYRAVEMTHYGQPGTGYAEAIFGGPRPPGDRHYSELDTPERSAVVDAILFLEDAEYIAACCNEAPTLLAELEESILRRQETIAMCEQLRAERDRYEQAARMAIVILTRIICANEEWLPHYIEEARRHIAGKEGDERITAGLRVIEERDAALAESAWLRGLLRDNEWSGEANEHVCPECRQPGFHAPVCRWKEALR